MSTIKCGFGSAHTKLQFLDKHRWKIINHVSADGVASSTKYANCVTRIVGTPRVVRAGDRKKDFDVDFAKMRSRKNWVNDVALTKLPKQDTQPSHDSRSQLHHAWVEPAFSPRLCECWRTGEQVMRRLQATQIYNAREFLDHLMPQTGSVASSPNDENFKFIRLKIPRMLWHSSVTVVCNPQKFTGCSRPADV